MNIQKDNQKRHGTPNDKPIMKHWNPKEAFYKGLFYGGPPFIPIKTDLLPSKSVPYTLSPNFFDAVLTKPEPPPVSIGSLDGIPPLPTSTIQEVVKEGCMKLNTPAESVFRNSHYSLGQNADRLIIWANIVVEALPKYLDGMLPLFCFSGYSGSSHATALTMKYFEKYGPKYGMAYVRKLNEKSHGSPVQINAYQLRDARVMFVFVDDCPGGGTTRVRTLALARQAASNNGPYSVSDMDEAKYITLYSSLLRIMPWSDVQSHSEYQLALDGKI